jgi:protein TonB
MVANGSRVANFNARSVWKNWLLSHLDRYKLYPDAVRAQRAKSIAFLNFGMDCDGRVLTFYLGRSSGCPDPDDETPAMIQRVSPLPSTLPELHEQVLQFVVPVRFSS